MKRTTLIAGFIALCTSLSLQAQKFGGSAFIGMTASQLDGDSFGGFDLPGLRLGAGTNLKLGDRTTLQMEIALVQKGSRELPSDTSNFYKARLNMVEIPLLLEYQLGPLAFEGGPALDILAHFREEANGFILNSEPSFERVSLAGIAGVSYYFNEKWKVNFRSAYSITSVRTPDGPYNPAVPRRLGGNGWRNANLSFAVYYIFDQPR